jgi:hypothetical protein
MTAQHFLHAGILATLIFGISRAEPAQPRLQPGESAKPTSRSLAEIRLDMRAALKAEARSRKAGDNPQDVLRLVQLYQEMAAHPKRESSDVLKEMGRQVRARLVTIRERIERQLARESTKDRKPSSTSPAATVLAQQLPGPGAAAAGQAAIVTGIPRASTGQIDFGPELVELIEATISPGIWRVNGGPAAVVYYAPRQVLVVSAPADIHAQVGGLLQQLDAAQREADGTQITAAAGAVQAAQ